MNRDLTIDLFDVLDLIACSFTYGHANQILFWSAAQWTGVVTDEEIREYLDSNFPLAESEGDRPSDELETVVGFPAYWTDVEPNKEDDAASDRREALEILMNWRNKYATEAELAGEPG